MAARLFRWDIITVSPRNIPRFAAAREPMAPPRDSADPAATASAAAAPAKHISRRKFLRRSLRGLAAVSAGTFLYTWRVEPHWVEIVERSLPIARLPSSLVGKRLVQLSDIHAGPVVDQSFLIRSAEL